MNAAEIAAAVRRARELGGAQRQAEMTRVLVELRAAVEVATAALEKAEQADAWDCTTASAQIVDRCRRELGRAELRLRDVEENAA